MLSSSCLFDPGDRPERFAKALANDADVVIGDLEDIVARATAVSVRSNAFGMPWQAAGLRLRSHFAVAAVVPPKAKDPAVIAASANRCRRCRR